MTDEPTPSLDERHGFVRAECASCGQPGVWLRCDRCKHADRFVLEGGRATCSCGATYTHAVCTCGVDVPGDRLRWVEWGKGPLSLADWEVDWRRVGIAAAVLVVAGALLGSWFWLS